MELVDGDDLATRIRHGAPFPPTMAVRIAADVASGLAVAHARGIVHRDVKPGNIILDRADRARITDFGVARIAAESESTIPGTTLGSVHYFSPEQARGLPTTPASDVYSLGLVLYEMLTGTRPFTGETTAAIALARVGVPAPHPRAVDPTLPPDVDAVVVRALDPDPAARYADCGAFADALERTLATAPAPALVAVDPTSTTASYAVQAPTSAVGRSDRGIAAPLLGIAAAVALLFGGFASSRHSAPARADPPSWPRHRTTRAPQPWQPHRATRPRRPRRTHRRRRTRPQTRRPSPSRPDAVICASPIRARPAPSRPAPTPRRYSSPNCRSTSATAGRPSEPAIASSSSPATRATSPSPVPVSTVFDGDQAYEVRANANDLLDAFRADTAVVVLEQQRARIDGHRAVQLDVVPYGDRAPLFGSGDDVFYVEPQSVTRLYVFEVRGEPVILALEGANGVDLDGFLNAADGAISSLNVG